MQDDSPSPSVGAGLAGVWAGQAGTSVHLPGHIRPKTGKAPSGESFPPVWISRTAGLREFRVQGLQAGPGVLADSATIRYLAFNAFTRTCASQVLVLVKKR